MTEFQGWSLLAGSLLAVIAMVCAVNIHSDYRIKQMVKAGANPLEAKCAVVPKSWCESYAAYSTLHK